VCVQGVPQLLVDQDLSRTDRWLRDYFYNGFLGRFYQFIMPFLTLPARPLKVAWRDWVIYFVVVGALLADALLLLGFVLNFGTRRLGALEVSAILFGLAACWFFSRHVYLFALLLLAIPVKLSLLATRFRPERTFIDVHSDWVGRFQQRQGKLRVLDISTGTCNSLFRHGWMKLNAEYVGLDLSQTMLLQGLEFMSRERIPVDFVIGDAQHLPFAPASFDIVLNYGALNGYADAKMALAEMARVVKDDGLVLFLDEQLYEGASFLERLYFRLVLSSHNVIHACPTDLIPADLTEVTVRQIYQFYYLCTCVKRAARHAEGISAAEAAPVA
jgi:ubiquinone/menaquinone biosynthesis C-methylase UbiE